MQVIKAGAVASSENVHPALDRGPHRWHAAASTRHRAAWGEQGPQASCRCKQVPDFIARSLLHCTRTNRGTPTHLWRRPRRCSENRLDTQKKNALQKKVQIVQLGADAIVAAKDIHSAEVVVPGCGVRKTCARGATAGEDLLPGVVHAAVVVEVSERPGSTNAAEDIEAGKLDAPNSRVVVSGGHGAIRRELLP